MDDRTVFVRTSKGDDEARGNTSQLFGDAKRAFILIDGRESVGDLRKHAAPSLRAVLEDTLQQLVKDGFIRDKDEKANVARASAPAPKMAAPKMAAPAVPKMATPAAHDSEDLLDFTSGSHPPVSVPPAPAPARATAPASPPATADLDFSSLIPSSSGSGTPAAEPPTPVKSAPATPSAPKPEPAKPTQEIDFAAIFAPSSGQGKGATDADAKVRDEAEAKARAETQARMKADAAANAKARAEAQARLMAKAEAKVRLEEQEKVAAETEARIKAETDGRARAAAAVRAEEQVRAEEKARVDAAARARAETEARAKAEAEAKARAAAQAREEKAASDVETQMRAMLEARSKAETEAKARAEASARIDADARARAESEAKARAEAEARQRAEARARAEAEARARARAEEFGRGGGGLDILKADLAGLAEPEKKPAQQPFKIDLAGFGAPAQTSAPAQPSPDVVEAAAREKARLEAEARRRAEQAADAAHARALQEAEAVRARAEQEAAKMKAEEESRRLAEAQLKAFEEAERRAKEQADARAKAQAQAEARGRADAKSLAKQARQQERSAKRSAKIRAQAQRQSASRAPVLVTVLLLAVAAIVALPYVWPMQDYVARTEQELSAQLKQPVHIGAMSAASLPLPKLVLQNVTVGGNQELRIGSVSLYFNVPSLIADNKAIDKAELQDVTIGAEAFSRVLPWLAASGSDPHYPVKRVVIRGAHVTGDVPVLPAFNGEMVFDPQGAFTGAKLTSDDGKTDFTLRPQQGRMQVELSLKDGALPLAPAIKFASFGAAGEIRDSGINFTNVDAILYGGTLKGTAYLAWQGGWSLQGRISVSAIDVDKLLPGLKISGEVSGDATLTMRGSRLTQLVNMPHLEGTVQMRDGTINSLDIAETLRTGSRDPAPGTSHFDRLNATLQVDGASQHLKQIRFVTGGMPASGSVDVTNGNLSGQLLVDMNRVRAGMGTVPLTMGGTVSGITWRGGR